MPENDRDRTAELELPGGEKGGTAELWSEVMDEIEMSVAEQPTNGRSTTAELELPGGEGGSSTGFTLSLLLPVSFT